MSAHRTSAARAAVGASALALTTLMAASLLVPVGVSAQETEEILSYDVTIDVEPGGRMLVTEAIRVRALGREIRRGIYRDVPTSFPRWSGLGRIEAPFEVTSVMRNGSPEPYEIQGIGGAIGRGGMRIRIGDADLLLEPGVHDYAISYETDRWIRFGDGGDRLYWNVTGNAWGFPIRSASAVVRMPELASTPTLESWTGPEGSTTTHAVDSWNAGTGVAEFRTDEVLRPGEGLTVSVTAPSGQLTPPTEAQQAEWFRHDWGGYIDAGYVVLFAIAVYLLMWRRVGMDPVGRSAVLRHEPPAGYSPAALGFIEERGYGQGQLSAAVVSMALKGALRIRNEDGDWTLEKVDAGVRLDPEERALFDALLGTRDRIRLEQSNHRTLSAGIKAFQKSLAGRLEREYFHRNRRWFAAGVLVSVIGFAALAWRWRFGIDPAAVFLGFWLIGWSAGVASISWRVWQMARAARTSGSASAWMQAGFLALFAIPFVGAEIFVIGLLTTMVPSHLVFAAVGLGFTNIAFYHLLERPTLKGRGVLDQLEGFRTYLQASDGRIAPRTDDRVAAYERFLPFAIALGLESRWTERFGDALAPVLAGRGGSDGLPWFHSRGSTLDAGSFSSSLGSGLSSTLSSASSAPSSGGSGSGGGSSGGGGGGGGGGGW